MTSLRSRLTLSYASLVAVVLIALAIILTHFAFAFLTQPTFDAVAQSVAAAEKVVAAHPHDDAATLRDLVRAAAERPGVVVLGGRDDGRRGPPPNTATDNAMRLSVDSLLGLRPRRVPFPSGGGVLIAPDLRVIRPAFTIYVESLAVAIVLALALSWLIARWITAQAIAPLITVTGELRRFAGGDFTPRSIATSDRSELGALITAFNGAAAQVSSAFAERARVEEQMRRFVADAGHELRTPLTVISGFVEVLEKGGVDDRDIRERSFRTLRTETRRMRRLVERLMALARLERPEPARLDAVNVAEIVADAVAEVNAARHGNVEINVLSQATGALADRGELHEAVGNLVDNAVKYGGASPVAVEVGTEGGNVFVRVRDHGAGIPEAERPHIFERFFRGEDASGIEGSGLGLAIVERAAARCGGTVRLENGVSAGTSFVLTIPKRSASVPPGELHVD